MTKCIVLALALALLDCGSAARAFDCAALEASKEPFQVTFAQQPADDTLVLQIVRHANLATTIWHKGEGSPWRSEMRAGLVMDAETPSRHGTAAYSIPLDRWYFETSQPIDKALAMDGTGKTIVTHFSAGPVADEDFSVGPCRFGVKHFVVTYRDSLPMVSSEWFFSTALQFPLKSVFVVEKGGARLAITRTAVAIGPADETEIGK